MNTLPSWADPWPEYPHNRTKTNLGWTTAAREAYLSAISKLDLNSPPAPEDDEVELDLRKLRPVLFEVALPKDWEEQLKRANEHVRKEEDWWADTMGFPRKKRGP